jgi:hypothetical protein
LLALLLGLACWSMPQNTAAHGYLAVPVSRNLYARQQNTFYDEMSGNGLGFGNTGGPGAQQVHYRDDVVQLSQALLQTQLCLPDSTLDAVRCTWASTACHASRSLTCAAAVLQDHLAG